MIVFSLAMPVFNNLSLACQFLLERDGENHKKFKVTLPVLSSGDAASETSGSASRFFQPNSSPPRPIHIIRQLLERDYKFESERTKEDYALYQPILAKMIDSGNEDYLTFDRDLDVETAEQLLVVILSRFFDCVATTHTIWRGEVKDGQPYQQSFVQCLDIIYPKFRPNAYPALAPLDFGLPPLLPRKLNTTVAEPSASGAPVAGSVFPKLLADTMFNSDNGHTVNKPG